MKLMDRATPKRLCCVMWVRGCILQVLTDPDPIHLMCFCILTFSTHDLFLSRIDSYIIKSKSGDIFALKRWFYLSFVQILKCLQVKLFIYTLPNL